MNRSRSQAKTLPSPHTICSWILPPSCLSSCFKINHSITRQCRHHFLAFFLLSVCMGRGARVEKGGGGVFIFWARFSPYMFVTRQFWSKFSKTFLGKCAYEVDFENLIWLKDNFITESWLIVRVGLDLQVGSYVYRMSKAMVYYLLPPMGCYKLR